MQPDRGSADTESSAWHLAAQIVLAAAVIAFGLWILHDFLAAIAWATVLAIALWPLYHHLLGVLPPRSDRVLAPLLATTAITVVIVAPLVLLGLALAREGHVVIGFVGEARHHGVPVPYWVTRLPIAGPTLAQWWTENLTDPAVAEELIGRYVRTLGEAAREYGGEIIHRVALLLFMLLSLFFLFRDGDALAKQLRRASDRLIGQRGERIGLHMIAAVHGTVNGLVLVGLAEGIILGAVYFAVGLPNPASIGALTGVAAVVPFVAPIVFVFAALYLFAAGNTLGGIVVIVFGTVLLFIADHFVRPVLIGGATRLPFLLVLFGILGGLETMGILGLFLGPAMMAAMVALWREWTDEAPTVEPQAAAVPHRPPARQARIRKA
jgi:predicted PurR-regulated permease PerM